MRPVVAWIDDKLEPLLTFIYGPVARPDERPPSLWLKLAVGAIIAALVLVASLVNLAR
jgi:hypothetical protein